MQHPDALQMAGSMPAFQQQLPNGTVLKSVLRRQEEVFYEYELALFWPSLATTAATTHMCDKNLPPLLSRLLLTKMLY